MDCSLQEWWRLTLLVLFPLGPPSGWRGGMGRRLPVNIWTWAGSGAAVERSQGSQAGEASAPPDTGLGRLSMCSPPPSQNKTMVKTRTDAREGGTAAISGTSDKGWLQTGRPVAVPPPSPESLELREGTGEPRTERGKGKSSRGGGGQAGSVVLLPPSSSGAGGSRVGGGPGGGGQSGHGLGDNQGVPLLPPP